MTLVQWMEVSTHSVTVTVPADFDPENADLGDALGSSRTMVSSVSS
ncbi:hypothetical protein [Rhodococcus artemisiae]|uniref:Uncharacterized protein n=1 Tax=Rhodococcus artemisiae TaxID=714159 RepID=A0ABU7LL21_9NOCA|nr:hypothetical protein [Rhodococcus artemisiae]MEE2062270.1 hypothetical protein [Rhodococcus artemisiae]